MRTNNASTSQPTPPSQPASPNSGTPARDARAAANSSTLQTTHPLSELQLARKGKQKASAVPPHADSGWPLRQDRMRAAAGRLVPHQFDGLRGPSYALEINRKKQLRLKNPHRATQSMASRIASNGGRALGLTAPRKNDDAKFSALTQIMRIPGYQVKALEDGRGPDGGTVVVQVGDDGKCEVRHYTGGLGDALPIIALEMLADVPYYKRTVPPLELLGDLVQTPSTRHMQQAPSLSGATKLQPVNDNDGPLWRLHLGDLYGYHPQTEQFEKVLLQGRKPHDDVQMHGLQADGRVLVSTGSSFHVLRADAVEKLEVQGVGKSAPVASSADGTLFALGAQGLVNQATGKALQVRLMDTDGKDSSIALSNIVQMKMLPDDAQPGASTVVLRDGKGHLYSGRLDAEAGLTATRMNLPFGAAYDICLTTGRHGQGVALNVALHDSAGRREGHVLDDGRLEPRWNLRDPVVVASDKGLGVPEVLTGLQMDERSALGLTQQGTLVRVGADGVPQRLESLDGKPLTDVFGIKHAPMAGNGMPGEMPVYAMQVWEMAEGGFETHIVQLDIGGLKQSMPVGGSPSLKAVPNQVHLAGAKPVLSTQEAIGDFAPDGKGGVFIAVAQKITRHAPGKEPEEFEALPGPAGSLAVSSEDNRLYALVPGQTNAPDSAATRLYRYDDKQPQGERWIDCRVQWREGEQPIGLSVSRAGSLQLQTSVAAPDERFGTKISTHRLLSPIDTADAHTLMPYAGEDAHEAIRQSIQDARIKVKGTRRYATLSTTVGNVKSNLSGVSAKDLALGAVGSRGDVGIPADAELQPYLAARLDSSRDFAALLANSPVQPRLEFRRGEGSKETVEASQTVRGNAVQGAQFALQKLAIYQGALRRDQRAQPTDAASVPATAPSGGGDRIAQMTQRWSAIRQALSGVGSASDGVSPLAKDELANVEDIMSSLQALRDQGIAWPADDEQSIEGRQRVGDVQLGAAERCLVTYEKALRIAEGSADGGPSELQALGQSLADDKNMALMRYGVRNIDIEARGHIEAVKYHRRELGRPGSVMRLAFDAAFGVSKNGTPAEMAQLMADYVKKMPARSMVYLVPESATNVGATLLVPAVVTGGAVNLSAGFQVEFGTDPYLGIEKNTYGVVLYPFQDRKVSASMDVVAGAIFNTARAHLNISGSTTDSFGTALLCPHEQLDEFVRQYLSDEDPLKMLDLGMEGARVGVGGPVQQHGAIGLNESYERVFNVTLRGGVEKSFGTKAQAFAPAAALRLQAMVGYRFREVHVNLPSGYAPVEGEMNMGGQGLLWGAQAYAGMSSGMLAPFVLNGGEPANEAAPPAGEKKLPDDVGLLLRWADVQALGADAQIYQGGSYRRTLEWGPAPRVTEANWSKLVDMAKASFTELADADVPPGQAREWLAKQLLRARKQGDAPALSATDEVTRQKFIDSVLDLEVQDAVSRQPGGGARLQPNSRLELNVTYRLPDDMDIASSMAHVGLGAVQKDALDPVKTVSHALRAMMTSEVNDVRLLFEVDPAILRDLNMGIVNGEWTADDVEAWLKKQPAIYRLSAVAPRNSGALSASVHMPVFPGMSNEVRFNMPAEWYNGMELKFLYGPEGIARADWMFSEARERLHEQPGVDYFAAEGAHLMPQKVPSAPT